MKRKNKTIAISLTSIALAVSTIFCCCLITTETTLIQKDLSPCHAPQSQDAHASHGSGECKCDQSFAAVKKAVPFPDIDLKSAVFGFSQLAVQPSIVFVAATLQAPPIIYADSPLYILHSVLRI